MIVAVSCGMTPKKVIFAFVLAGAFLFSSLFAFPCDYVAGETACYFNCENPDHIVDYAKDDFDQTETTFSPISDLDNYEQKVAEKYDYTAQRQVQPWRIEITLTFGEKSWHYDIGDNISDLTQYSLQNRALFNSCAVKKRAIDDLVSKGYTLPQAVCYILPNFSRFVLNIQNDVNTQPQSATATFSNGRFHYTADVNGLEVDCQKLYQIIYARLSPSINLSLPTRKVPPEISLEQIKEDTSLRGEFSTVFDSENISRSSNIALALSQFNNMVVLPNQTVSFNYTTGARTVDRGYKTAKIIVDGKYVDGVGGGVCQASTTLYNALLLSGVQVLVRHPHTLKASYIAPSFDAMVNGQANDLIFVNQTDKNIYIFASAKGGRATVKIFGVKNPYRIERISTVLEKNERNTVTIIDHKGEFSDKVKFDDESYIQSHGSDRIKSTAKLRYYLDGKFAFEKLLHTDVYKRTDRIVVKGAIPRPPEIDKAETNPKLKENPTVIRIFTAE